MAITPLAPVGRGAPNIPDHRNNSTRGIAFMAIGLFLFSAVDMQAKLLTATLHPVQIMWSRQLGLLLGVAILFAIRGPVLFKTAHLKLQITRGALAASSGTMFIVAVAYVPLADAVAVSFVAPFIVTIFGALVLKEAVGARRWAAVTIGFIGTLIVMRPGLGAVHPAVLVVIGAATAFALRQILSRVLSGSDKTETTVAYTAVVGSAVLSVPLVFVWRTPTETWEIAVLICMALMAAIAETFVIKALEVAQAVVVAPVQYSMLIYGVIYGWLIFGQLPDIWTWIGALIIVATGLYTLNRERLVGKRAKA